MFYSYIFDNIPGELDDGLPNNEGFLLLSQSGFLRCVEKSVPLKATVISHLERCIIRGDRHSGVHYFLTAAVLEAGQESVQALQKKLAIELKLGCSTYNSLLSAQRVIVAHFEQAIASLIEKVDDDDHAANFRLFKEITNNYSVLTRFNPRYHANKIDWQRRTDSYRQLFCREPELATVSVKLQ